MIASSASLSAPSPHRADPAGAPAQFLVGQDAQGHWLAVGVDGRSGGIFRSRSDAEHYAAGETARRPGAVARAAGCLRLVP